MTPPPDRPIPTLKYYKLQVHEETKKKALPTQKGLVGHGPQGYILAAVPRPDANGTGSGQPVLTN